MKQILHPYCSNFSKKQYMHESSVLYFRELFPRNTSDYCIFSKMPYENFTVHTPVHVRARAHTHTHARTHTHTHTPTPTHARARARAHTHTHIYFVFLTYPYNTLIFSKQIIQISKSMYSRMNAVRVLSHLIQSVLLNDI